MAEEPEAAPEVDDRELQDVILDALSDWLGDTGMVTGFHVIADFIDADGDESYMSAVANGQSQSRTLGLLAWAQRIAEYEVKQYLDTYGED